MNKNATSLILIVIAIGVYFTFTRTKIDEYQSIQAVNTEYQNAIAKSEDLIKVRDDVRSIYNKIDPEDQARLDKMLPDNVDNVRLIIDVNSIASRHNIAIKNVKTITSPTVPNSSSPTPTTNTGKPATGTTAAASNKYNTVSLSFDVSGSYKTFVDFLTDLEASLRIIEISKINLKANDTGTYDYSVEIKTFWLKQ